MSKSRPKAVKLPSGSWRTRVFSHKEPIVDEKGKRIIDNNGIPKTKNVYKSFTASTPKESEFMALQYSLSEKDGDDIPNWTLKTAMNKYIESKSSILSPRTIQDYKSVSKNYFQTILMKRISTITQSDIQTEINVLSTHLSAKTVSNAYGFLSTVLRTYRPDFALNVTLPKKGRPKLYVPSDSDIKMLLDGVRDTAMEIPILLAAFGPMRRGEISALHTDYINGNIVHVKWNMVLVDNKVKGKKEYKLKDTKSYAGDRYIEYPDFVISKMAGIEGKITALTPDVITDRFPRILRRLGLPHFRFHDLRHYCASTLHALGIPDSYIMERGGWKNDRVLKDVYRHTMESITIEMNQKANKHFKSLYKD